MTLRKKVLVTGGSGLLGCATFIAKSRDWDVLLWLRKHKVDYPNIATAVVKLEEYDEVYSSLEKNPPDILLHAAGMTNIEECEQNEYRAYLSNVIATKNLAKACAALNIKFVFISTDQVLKDGDSSLEDDLGFPKNVYSKTKIEAEYEALRYNQDCLILRTNFYAWGHTYRKSFLDFIVDNLRAKKEVTLFDDVKFNPLSANTLLSYVERLVDNSAVGVFNLSGDEQLSKYEFGLLTAEVFNLDKSYIKKGRLSDTSGKAKRPFNMTMSNSKLKNELALLKTPTTHDFLTELKLSEVEYKAELQDAISEVLDKNLISYGKQTIEDSDFEAMLIAVDSPWLTQGPRVEEFERKVAAYTGSKYAVAMMNWTCGLHMAVLAAGVKPGDYVITSPLSFVASSNCASYVGAIPYFVDIDPVTLNMDPIKLEEACKKLGSRVKAIIPVHFTGAPCDMEKISAIAKRYKAVVIEDAAHAIGGSYKCGTKIGNNKYSAMVGFSFHPVKNLTTGEGGLITTDDETIYRKLLRLRSHGITKGDDKFLNLSESYTAGKKNPWYHEMQELGFNFRITDLQCALGCSQLKKVDSFLKRKLEIAEAYDYAFSELTYLKTVQRELRQLSGNHLYVVKVDFKNKKLSRHELFEAFRKRGINLHVHYIPIYKQPFYQANYPVDEAEFVNTEEYYSKALTLPIYPGMTRRDMNNVIASVKELIG